MRKLFISLSLIFTLTACSFSGFKPPKSYYFWRTKKISSYHETKRYYDTKRQDMIDCGMDLVTGESGKAKVNLCMESKGWYLDKGPVCEDKVMLSTYNDPLCVQWRAKHHSK